MKRLVRRGCAALVAATALTGWAFDGEARQARLRDIRVSHWHVGPFFEYRRAVPGPAVYWAFRPFYSRIHDPVTETTVHDVLWPLGTWHAHRGEAWWRGALAYGDARTDDPSWSANVFPLWFSGADRSGDGYWGLFPLYGNHPHALLMDDWSFALWPLWQTYTVKDVRSRAVLWPFVTWRESPRAGVGVWPFFGTATQRESKHAYALWPFFTWADYQEDRDTSGFGTSWMFWPVFGQVRRARETQTMVLPPFFSYARTDDAVRWRLPWPLVEVARSAVRNRTSVWPFYESVDGYSYGTESRKDLERTEPPVERTRRYGWFLVEDLTVTSSTHEETRFTVFPFWTRERRYEKKPDGTRREVASYTRVWPFWSRVTKDGLSRQWALELNPIRHAEGVDRNWSPFWTFWESEDRPNGRTRQSLFWHLVTWHTGSGEKADGRPRKDPAARPADGK